MYKLATETIKYARDADRNHQLTSAVVARKLQENADKAKELAAVAPKEATKDGVISTLIGSIATYSKVDMQAQAVEAIDRLEEAIERQ